MQPEFIFKSKFSTLIRKTFLDNEMYLRTVAENMGCDVPTISAYYNDKKILTTEHAQAFSDLLRTLNVYYSADGLIKMQKQAEFIVCDNRPVAEILGINVEKEK